MPPLIPLRTVSPVVLKNAASAPLIVTPTWFELGRYKPVFRLPKKFSDGLVAEPVLKVSVLMLFDTEVTDVTLVPSHTMATVAPVGIVVVEPPLIPVENVNVYVPDVLFVMT